MSDRVPGHGLRAEGAAFTDLGERVRSQGTGGVGRARCECGSTSDILGSGLARQRWHRWHKAEAAERARGDAVLLRRKPYKSQSPPWHVLRSGSEYAVACGAHLGDEDHDRLLERVGIRDKPAGARVCPRCTSALASDPTFKRAAFGDER